MRCRRRKGGGGKGGGKGGGGRCAQSRVLPVRPPMEYLMPRPANTCQRTFNEIRNLSNQACLPNLVHTRNHLSDSLCTELALIDNKFFLSLLRGILGRIEEEGPVRPSESKNRWTH